MTALAGEGGTYTVHFDEGAEGVDGSMVDATAATGESWNLPKCMLTRTGYSFHGWTTQPDGSGMVFSDGRTVKDLAEAGETITLYARWNTYEYIIQFDKNKPITASTEVDGPINNFNNIPYHQTVNLPPNEFTLPGYGFTGWNDEPDGSGTQCSEGAIIQEQFLTGDNGTVTLYAQWAPIEYRPTFDSGTGTDTKWKDGFFFDTEAQLPPVATLGFSGPSGLPFIGWLAEGVNRFYADQEMVKNVCTLDEDGDPEGLTLTVLWGYKVTLCPHGGEIADCAVDSDGNYVFDYTQDSGTTLPSGATRTGYQFAGWYDGDSRVTSVSAADSGKTYDARWTANTYTVTFDANGVSIAQGKNVTSYTYGVGAALPTAADITRNGYIFQGWYETPDFSGDPVTEITATDTGNKTYYAKWQYDSPYSPPPRPPVSRPWIRLRTPNPGIQ